VLQLRRRGTLGELEAAHLTQVRTGLAKPFAQTRKKFEASAGFQDCRRLAGQLQAAGDALGQAQERADRLVVSIDQALRSGKDPSAAETELAAVRQEVERLHARWLALSRHSEEAQQQ